MPNVHGAPVHMGDPEKVGVKDIMKPDYGEAVDIYPGEIPVFWPCGVTPQAAVENVIWKQKKGKHVCRQPSCRIIRQRGYLLNSLPFFLSVPVFLSELDIRIYPLHIGIREPVVHQLCDPALCRKAVMSFGITVKSQS